MGVLPLQFQAGQSAKSLGLSGEELFDIAGLADGLAPGKEVRVTARKAEGSPLQFTASARIDTPQEVLYYKHGGILQYVLRQLLARK
jgi:aconitate hydratase